MSKLLMWLGLEANKEEKHILEMLNKNALPSMRIVGRGTLTMDAIEARSTEAAKNYIKDMEKMDMVKKDTDKVDA